jgi:hypothetical protein
MGKGKIKLVSFKVKKLYNQAVNCTGMIFLLLYRNNGK